VTAKARRRSVTGPPRKEQSSPFAKWMDGKHCTLSAAELAKRLGVSVKTVYNYRSGNYRPALEGMLLIEKLSAGRVAMGDWKKP
jgi:hypothetical protein